MFGVLRDQDQNNTARISLWKNLGGVRATKHRAISSSLSVNAGSQWVRDGYVNMARDRG